MSSRKQSIEVSEPHSLSAGETPYDPPETKSKRKESKITRRENTSVSVIPECSYHLLLVTPEWFYQGSRVFKKHLDA